MCDKQEISVTMNLRKCERYSFHLKEHMINHWNILTREKKLGCFHSMSIIRTHWYEITECQSCMPYFGPFYKHGLTLIPAWISNYADPLYGVATICQQVRCLRWGHPSLIHTAMSLLIWYKMFCLRDISYRLIWMKYINMLSVYA